MAMQTFDDEFESIPAATTTATTAQATPAAQPKPQQQAAQPAAQTHAATHHTAAATKAAVSADEDEPTPSAHDDADEGLDTDFDDEKIYDRPGQLDIIRPDKGREACRFALLPKEWIAPQSAKNHYTEITGSDGKLKKVCGRCLTPMGNDVEQKYCCQALGKDGSVQVVALAVHYLNADPTDGSYKKDANGNVPPIKWKIGFVRLSPFNMKQIKKLPDEDKTPFDIDMVMVNADRAFGYEFYRKSTSPRWKQDAETIAQVKAAASRFINDGGKILRSKLGQKMNETEWKALLSGKKVGAESKIDNIEEL
jgi:hypothetical protein